MYSIKDYCRQASQEQQCLMDLTLSLTESRGAQCFVPAFHMVVKLASSKAEVQFMVSAKKKIQFF